MAALRGHLALVPRTNTAKMLVGVGIGNLIISAVCALVLTAISSATGRFTTEESSSRDRRVEFEAASRQTSRDHLEASALGERAKRGPP